MMEFFGFCNKLTLRTSYSYKLSEDFLYFWNSNCNFKAITIK